MKSSNLKYAIYGLSGLLAVIIGLNFIFGNVYAQPPSKQERTTVREDVALNSEFDQLGIDIHLAHEGFNNSICFGEWQGYRSPIAASWSNLEVIHRDTITGAIERAYAATRHPVLKEDIQDALTLTAEGFNDHDIDKLIQAHRILHDLDVQLFGDEGFGNFFNATRLLG